MYLGAKVLQLYGEGVWTKGFMVRLRCILGRLRRRLVWAPHVSKEELAGTRGDLSWYKAFVCSWITVSVDSKKTQHWVTWWDRLRDSMGYGRVCLGRPEAHNWAALRQSCERWHVAVVVAEVWGVRGIRFGFAVSGHRLDFPSHRQSPGPCSPSVCHLLLVLMQPMTLFVWKH